MAEVLPPYAPMMVPQDGRAAGSQHHATLVSLPHDYAFAFVAKAGPAAHTAVPQQQLQQQQQLSAQGGVQSAGGYGASSSSTSFYPSTVLANQPGPSRLASASNGTYPSLPPALHSSSAQAANYTAQQSTRTHYHPAPPLPNPRRGEGYESSGQVPLPLPSHQLDMTSTGRRSLPQEPRTPPLQADPNAAPVPAPAVVETTTTVTPPSRANPTKTASSSTPKEPSTRPSTERIATFFASLVCYIWFAAGLPDTSPLHTPSLSPTMNHAPLFPSPLALAQARRSQPNLRAGKQPSQSQQQGMAGHQRSAASTAAGPSSTLPTDDFANRLSAAMARAASVVVAATAGVRVEGVDGVDGVNHAVKERAQASLRMQPSSRFVAFIKHLLSTTQVSSSVILLALLYIFRLKSRHPELHGQQGSEYRLSVTSLMLANKWLDDHTYLNKTWSELSGIELRDVTKMEREFWTGLGMDISVSDVEFQDWLKQVENMTARREAKIQRRALDLRNRQMQMQRRQARAMVRAGSSSPSRRVPGGRTSVYASRAQEPEENYGQLFAPHNSPEHPWRPELAADVTVVPLPTPPMLQHRPYSSSSPVYPDPYDGHADMIGSRRLPPPLPSTAEGSSASRDRSVPRRLMGSRPSSASSGGSFAAMHQSFKAMSAHSPSTALGPRAREQEPSPPLRSSKRFAADPEWVDHPPFVFNAPPAGHGPGPGPVGAGAVGLGMDALGHADYPSAAAPTSSNQRPVRPPRAIPAHEVHQPWGHYGYEYEDTNTNTNTHAEALVAPFTGYDAALMGAHAGHAPALAYYEVRSGPYRSVQGIGEPAPFVQQQYQQQGHEAWETLRQAAQHFASSSNTTAAGAGAMGFAHVSPETRWESAFAPPQQQARPQAGHGVGDVSSLESYTSVAHAFDVSPYQAMSTATHAPVHVGSDFEYAAGERAVLMDSYVGAGAGDGHSHGHGSAHVQGVYTQPQGRQRHATHPAQYPSGAGTGPTAAAQEQHSLCAQTQAQAQPHHGLHHHQHRHQQHQHQRSHPPQSLSQSQNLLLLHHHHHASACPSDAGSLEPAVVVHGLAYEYQQQQQQQRQRQQQQQEQEARAAAAAAQQAYAAAIVAATTAAAAVSASATPTADGGARGGMWLPPRA